MELYSQLESPFSDLLCGPSLPITKSLQKPLGKTDSVIGIHIIKALCVKIFISLVARRSRKFWNLETLPLNSCHTVIKPPNQTCSNVLQLENHQRKRRRRKSYRYDNKRTSAII